MSRILLLTTEPLPLPGWPTTGAGLRAWNLALGLRARGHMVTVFMPEDAAASFEKLQGASVAKLQLPEGIETFQRKSLKSDLRLRDCDAIVLQHWGLARDLPELTVPLAIDLAGPHLLERRFWGSSSPDLDLAEKLDALRRADFLTASGQRQRDYFLAFLTLAGWDMAGQNFLPVIPYSIAADPNPAPVRADRFIYGGFFLPWQNPEHAIDTLLAEMDKAGRGELLFIGGAHPHADVSRGQFEALESRLKSHPRVRLTGAMSYDAYLALLREGGVALDLMQRNAERELAFTSRTVQYLALGLPVIHDDYSELGETIERARAGWALNPDDPERLARLVRGLLTGEIDPKPFAEAAHTLAAAELNPEKTIEPLAHFCDAPTFRAGKLRTRLEAEARALKIDRLETELREARSERDTLLGKRWVRWGLLLFSARTLAAPLAAIAGFAIGLILLFRTLWNGRGGNGAA